MVYLGPGVLSMAVVCVDSESLYLYRVSPWRSTKRCLLCRLCARRGSFEPLDRGFPFREIVG